jgi:CHAT domain-containing protein
MKKKFIVLCCMLPALLAAQPPDSTAIKQVDSLVQVSRAFTDQRSFDKALEAIVAAEAIVLKKIGPESAIYGKICHNYGRLFQSSNNLEEAEKWYLKAIDIRGKILGKDHPDYGSSLNNLGNVYLFTGKYDKAEPLYLAALGIREKTVGKEHPDYAGIAINLGSVNLQMNRIKEAEPFLLEAQYIFETKLNDRNHPFYWNCMRLLANLYKKKGEYKKSEQLLLEIKSHVEKEYGKGHLLYAQSLTNLGLFYLSLGNYESVEPLYLEALAIQENVLGKNSSERANTLNLLGVYYNLNGNTQKAIEMFLESKYIRENTEGKNFKVEYAGLLINLGELYTNEGNKDKEAEAFLLEAKDFFEVKLNNRNHSYYGNCLVDLARLYGQQGYNEKAEMFYLQAIDAQKKSLGEENPDYAMKLYNLGEFYQNTGQYEKAETLLLEARNIWAKTLGTEHPNYEMSLNLLGLLYERLKKHSLSQPLLAEGAALGAARLVKSNAYLSERELAIYKNAYQNSAITMGNCLFTRPRVAGEIQAGILPSLAFNQSLFYKGFLLNTSGRLHNLADNNPEVAEINSRFKNYRRQLAAEYAKPINERIEVAALEEKADAAEKELASRILGTGYAEAIRQVKWQDVQATLKAGEAAIEFVDFKVDFPNKTDSIMYAALVLVPLPAVGLSKEGGAEQPQFIPLFEAKQLETLLKPTGKQKVDWVNQLYAETGNPQTSLYELLWRPLEPALAGVQTIYFSPSSQLHRLNLGAIAIPPVLRGPSEATTLGERYRLIEVGSTRQLVTGSGQHAAGNDAMLFGGIQYELDSTAIASANTNLEYNLSASRNRGLDFAGTDSTLRGGKWKYLPWTKVEVTALDGILAKAGFKATLHKDYEASEEAFKSLGVNQPSPRILHLATHGFFFPDPKTADGKRLTEDGSEPVFKMSDHPMIRSGLLLAGSNYAWEKGKPFKPEAEDGILTAYEISQMNLSNTELVVLSACETGLGDIQGNEGVYGLQRAFKIAGAKYLIMSLWQVPDFQTQQLMSAFYRNWLQDKMSIPDAFRTAQQAMQLKFKDPFFWAGFVLVE